MQLPGQPAPNKVVNFQPVSLRELKDLSVVYDARGRQLTLDRSVVPAEGDSRSGPPSKGEVVRLLSTGILALKEKNNLKITDPIPAGSVVVVTIQGKFGATTLPINADLFPRPDRVSEQAFRTADRDQYNRKAITELAQERGGDLSIRVTHEPGGVASIKYNQDIKFELMPMPKP